MRIGLLVLCFNIHLCFSQTSFNHSTRDSVEDHRLFYANTLSTHPLGVFMSRLHHQFEAKAIISPTLSIQISNGNVWLPYVKGYLPTSPTDRKSISELPWYERSFVFDPSQTPTSTKEFHADGNLRVYHVNLQLPLGKHQDLKIRPRIFSLDRGRPFFSPIMSDQFIEWFHSNVAGGEDPFARKDYGYNHAHISYTDEMGRSFQLSQNDVVFSGIELAYRFFPSIPFFRKRHIYPHLTLHTGLNTTKTNPIIDLGLLATAMKKISLHRHKQLWLGGSIGILRPGLLRYGEGVELSNRPHILSMEFMIDYRKRIDARCSWSLANTFSWQSAYNRPTEHQHIVLTGERIVSFWHMALSHLYRSTKGNNLVFTYSVGRFGWSFYLREDLVHVDNAPDLQAGMGVRVGF